VCTPERHLNASQWLHQHPPHHGCSLPQKLRAQGAAHSRANKSWQSHCSVHTQPPATKAAAAAAAAAQHSTARQQHQWQRWRSLCATSSCNCGGCWSCFNSKPQAPMAQTPATLDRSPVAMTDAMIQRIKRQTQPRGQNFASSYCCNSCFTSRFASQNSQWLPTVASPRCGPAISEPLHKLAAANVRQSLSGRTVLQK